MTSIAELRLPERRPTWASEGSAETQRSIRRLSLAGQVGGLSTSLIESSWIAGSSSAERRFLALADRWRKECGPLSSIREMILHPAYQQIIGMGPDVLPYILDELERQPDHWFLALRAITGEDPVRQQNRGRVREMARDWLEWAERRGLR